MSQQSVLQRLVRMAEEEFEYQYERNSSVSDVSIPADRFQRLVRDAQRALKQQPTFRIDRDAV